MALQSVLFTQDPKILGTLPTMLKDAGISVEVYPSAFPLPPSSAVAQKVDTIFVDFQLQAADDIVRGARTGSRGSILTVALANDHVSAKNAFAAGATLVISKPLSREKVLSGVRIARGFMVQERRRTMRFPLQAAISFKSADGKPLNGIGVNVNRGGLGFRMEQLPKIGQQGELRFILPGTRRELVAKTEVRWVDPDKKCGGVRFLKLSPESLLSDWIADCCDNALNSRFLNPQVTHRG